MFDSLLNALFVVGLNYVICEKEVTVKTSTVETLMGSCSFPCNLTRKRQTASRAIREPEVNTLLTWKIEHEHKMSNICYKTYL